MKRVGFSKLSPYAWLPACLVIGGCGVAPPQEFPDEQEDRQSLSSALVSEPSENPGEADFILRRCRATCDVSGPAGVCPSRVEAVRTSFLGGCSRACVNAQNAATGGLSPSCTVLACRTTCPAG